MPGSRPQNSTPWKIFRQSDFSGKIALALSTWFGTGLVPVASGTVGTLATVPFLFCLDGLEAGLSAFILMIVIGVAIWTADRSQGLLGRNDPSEVVIDEVAGFLVTLFLVPLSWLALALGFTLFRFFDILKPYPVRQAERLRGGLGIVMDDLLAGLYAHICLRVILSLY